MTLLYTLVFPIEGIASGVGNPRLPEMAGYPITERTPLKHADLDEEEPRAADGFTELCQSLQGDPGHFDEECQRD